MRGAVTLPPRDLASICLVKMLPMVFGLAFLVRLLAPTVNDFLQALQKVYGKDCAVVFLTCSSSFIVSSTL